MDIWDDDCEDFKEVVKNEYLKNPEKGLALIAMLLNSDNDFTKSKQVKKLDYLIDNSLLNSVDGVNLKNEMALSQMLNKISDKLEEYKKIKLLRNKTIIGIGGMFSAGKSKFINALVNEDILPEDQKPTTSIPTYILKANEEVITAYTVNNQEVELDLHAMQALTHEFYDKYKLGFSQFVRNLVIKNNKIEHSRIAILDTPGYNKYDSSEKKTVSDEKKAYEQLGTADFLIWLIDIETGVIHNNDIEFIRTLDIKTPILFIFNKADKKTKNEIEMIVVESEKILSSTSLNVYGVTAYSSFEGKEYLDRELVNMFIKDASEFSDRKEDIQKQFNGIITTLNDDLDKMKKKALSERNTLGNAIFKSEDILSIKSLVKLYADVFDQLDALNKCVKNVNNVGDNIKYTFQSLTR